MNENISRLMDGELDDAEFERCCELSSRPRRDAKRGCATT